MSKIRYLLPMALMAGTLGIYTPSLVPIHAQGKPNPIPIDPQADERVSHDAFVRAYERSGEPSMLVIVGVQNDRPLTAFSDEMRNATLNERREIAGEQSQLATGEISRLRFVGKGLNLFDRSGVSTSLQSSIEEILLENNDVDLVSADALSERQRREVQLLKLNSEERAIRLMATNLNADVVILVRMLQNDETAAQGARYRVNVEMLDVSRGRKIGGFAYDWERGTDSRMIKRYAQAVTSKLKDQYTAWYSDGPAQKPNRFTINVIGLSGIAAAQQMNEALAAIPGVSFVKTSSFTRSDEISRTGYRVKYHGGAMELVALLRQYALKNGVVMEGLDASAGTITLRVTGATEVSNRIDPSEYAPILLNPKDPRYQRVKKLLADAYNNAGRPKIGFLLNRTLTASERDRIRLTELGDSGGPANEVIDGRVLIVDPSGGADRDVLRYIRLNPLGSALYQDFMVHDVNNLMKPEALKKALRENLGLNRVVATDGEIFKATRDIEQLDLLTLVEASLVKNPDSGEPTLSYTFRMLDMKTGETTAGYGWSSESGEISMGPRESFEQALSRHATAYLLAQMMRVWASDSSIAVTIHEVKNQREVIGLMSALQGGSALIDQSRFDGFDGDTATGRFRLKSDSSPGEIMEELSRLSEALPFEIMSSDAGKGEVKIVLKR